MDSHFFLSKPDIQQLTGRIRPSAQLAWLSKHDWKFTIDALGNPVIAINEAESKLVGKSTSNHSNKEPNWEALHG